MPSSCQGAWRGLFPRACPVSPVAVVKRTGLKLPHDRLERSLSEDGSNVLAGLDEVGRGAWAGPVSVGVVVPPHRKRPPKGLKDSKLLSEERREELYPLVTKWCLGWAVGHAGPDECDALGMTAALRLAARRALAGLAAQPEIVLMDGNFDYLSDPLSPSDAEDASVPAEPAPTPHQAVAPPASPVLPAVHTVIKGDLCCVSIAAASIVAKVTRDRMMRSMSESFPGFDFHQNKGYPSPVHRTALAGFGLTSLHRRSWSFVEEMAFR
jgi:ribonuclease HII